MMSAQLFYRSGFALIIALTYFSTSAELKAGDRPGTAATGRLQPLRVLYPRLVPAPLLHLVFLAALAGFVTGWWPLLSTVVASALFIGLCSAYLSSPRASYVVINSNGTAERHVFHHLHLAGLCTVGACLAAIVAALPPAARGTLFPAEPFVPFMRVCIGAHYCMAGVEKIRRQGLSWPNRQLFPFYTRLMELYYLGDHNAQKKPEAGWLARFPRLGEWLLWLALISELSACMYPLNGAWRVVTGILLLALHVACLFVFRIDFRENMLLLLLFSFNYFGYSLNNC